MAHFPCFGASGKPNCPGLRLINFPSKAFVGSKSGCPIRTVDLKMVCANPGRIANFQRTSPARQGAYVEKADLICAELWGVDSLFGAYQTRFGAHQIGFWRIPNRIWRRPFCPCRSQPDSSELSRIPCVIPDARIFSGVEMDCIAPARTHAHTAPLSADLPSGSLFNWLPSTGYSLILLRRSKAGSRKAQGKGPTTAALG
jgi:hypothetical protein